MQDWLNEAWLAYGEQIHKDSRGRDWVKETTGLTDWKAKTLVAVVKERGPSPEVIEAAAPAWFAEANYVYNQEKDQYVTFVPGLTKPVVTSGDTHRAMKRAYSDWDGQPATINAMCREFKIPRAVLEKYKRVHGWTHDADPFTNEDMMARSAEELVSDALEQRRYSMNRKFEVEKWKETQQEADKWRRFEATIITPLLAAMVGGAPKVAAERIALPQSKEVFALVVSPQDFHYGAYGWVDEVGESYTREEERRRLLESTSALAGRLPGAPEKIVFGCGGDWFHI